MDGLADIIDLLFMVLIWLSLLTVGGVFADYLEKRHVEKNNLERARQGQTRNGVFEGDFANPTR